jgi:hypothetical protein
MKKYNINYFMVCDIKNKFSKNAKLIINNKRKNYLNIKFTDIHKTWIKNTINNKLGSYFTLSSLKYDIIQEFPELKDFSISTLSYFLKNELNMRYKKSSKLEIKMKYNSKIKLIS